MRRKLILLTLAALLLAVVSGCADARYHLTINPNGSGDIDLRVALQAETMIALRGLGLNPLADMGKNLEGEGYSVEPYEDTERMGITARRHVRRITGDSDLFPGALFSVADEGSPVKGIQVNREFLKTRYRFEAAVDPAALYGERQAEGLGAYLLDQADFDFILTLPLLPDSHNAHSTQDEGHTLLWHLTPGQVNLILVEASHWNTASLGLAAAATILVFAGLAAAVYYKKKNEQK